MARWVILSGVIVGRGAVIAAGSVVVSDVEIARHEPAIYGRSLTSASNPDMRRSTVIGA
jgi:tetrahydrodipicolinate N-succinyltransferase